jgi:quercetin dioxygenase-like cupin family protein
MSTSTERRGLQTFRHGDAPLLHETAMMSMPVMHPEATEQMMEWATGGGQQVKVLFGDPESGGPSLVWSWFGPDYILPRHSHSADCLYYVTRGELRMGNTALRAGDGFFVPSGAPSAYTAGPEGVEILEFRTTSPFDMQITESLPRWDRILEGVRANRDRWATTAPDA